MTNYNASDLLTRRQLAEGLTALGFKISATTLASIVTRRDDGPEYQLFNGRALYEWGPALEWARSRLSPPRRSTSQADAAQWEGRDALR
jgi:hypothetical protein